MLNGEQFSWDVDDPYVRIDSVGFMERLYYLHGVPPDEQRFIFKGKQIDTSRTFRHYGIEDGSGVHMVQRLR